MASKLNFLILFTLVAIFSTAHSGEISDYISKYFIYSYNCACKVLKNDNDAGRKSCTGPAIEERELEDENRISLLKRIVVPQVNENECNEKSNKDGKNPDRDLCWENQNKLKLWSDCMGNAIEKALLPNSTEEYIDDVRNRARKAAECYRQNGGKEACLLYPKDIY